MTPADPVDGAVVALTTSGWNVGEGLDMNRLREFGAGVLAVRASMTGVPGLRSQQSFFFHSGAMRRRSALSPTVRAVIVANSIGTVLKDWPTARRSLGSAS